VETKRVIHMGVEFWNQEELYGAVWDSPLIKVALKYWVLEQQQRLPDSILE
jgi:hypothetical protein